jgi:hypothetical protein
MRRREFVGALAGAAAWIAWPHNTCAEPRRDVRRIGIWLGGPQGQYLGAIKRRLDNSAICLRRYGLNSLMVYPRLR